MGNKKFSRREFLGALAAASSQLILRAPLAGLVGATLLPLKKANAWTRKNRFVFLYFDGGIRGYETFSPQLPASRALSSGEIQTSDHVPRALIENGRVMPNYATKELGGGYSLVPGTHANITLDGQSVYAPPIFMASNGLRYGFCVADFLQFAAQTTMIQGVTTSVDHGPAAQILLTGSAFDLAFPRPPIDCLLASKLGGGLLLPHLIWTRSNYVPRSFPQDNAQLNLGFPINGTGYRNFLKKLVGSPLAKTESSYVGDKAAAALRAYWDATNESMGETLQNPANLSYLKEMQVLRSSRDQLWQSTIIGGAGTAIDSFVSAARTTVDATVGADIGGTVDSLLPALGMAKYALDRELSSVVMMNIGMGRWDAHGGWYPSHPGHYRAHFCAIAEFLKRIDLNTTTVVICNELGRTTSFNQLNGTDHHPGSPILLIGGKLGQGVSFGGTDAFLSPLNVNPDSGAAVTSGGLRLKPVHLLALLLEYAGYEKGRPIETIMGITEAPAFLRKLL